MASKSHKLPENAPGKFYVERCCIANGACMRSAPNNFAKTADGSAFYVCRQPANEEETRQMMEALEGCPVDAIGADGEEGGAKGEGIGSKLQRWLSGGR